MNNEDTTKHIAVFTNKGPNPVTVSHHGDIIHELSLIHI